MNTVAVGFWGAFFGSVALMLAGSLLAYVRSMHSVALRGALTALPLDHYKVETTSVEVAGVPALHFHVAMTLRSTYFYSHYFTLSLTFT